MNSAFRHLILIFTAASAALVPSLGFATGPLNSNGFIPPTEQWQNAVAGDNPLTAEEAAEVEVPTTEAIHDPETTHPMWDRLGFWTIVAVLGVVAAYLPVLISYLPLNNVSTGINTIY